MSRDLAAMDADERAAAEEYEQFVIDLATELRQIRQVHPARLSTAGWDARMVGQVLSQVAEHVPDLELRADLLRALAADQWTRSPKRLTWADGRRRAALLLRRQRHSSGRSCQVPGCGQCPGGEA